MKISRKMSALAFPLLVSSFGLVNPVLAQESSIITAEVQDEIGALLKSIDMRPECTQVFINSAVGNNNEAAVEIILAAINAQPDSIVDIVVAAVQARPGLKDTILEAALETIEADDVMARADLVYAVEDLQKTTGSKTAKLEDNKACVVESIAELEEIDQEPEEIAELAEAPAPAPIPAAPTFNPGSNDKPIGVSPN